MTIKAILYAVLFLTALGAVFTVRRSTDSIRFRRKCGAYGDHAAFALRSLAVCLFIELFIFNFNSTHLLNGSYPRTALDISSAVLTNFDPETGTNIDNGSSSIEFRQLNTPIGTLTVHGESDKKSSVSFTVDITDDTYSAAFRTNIASIQAIQGNECSQTIPCNFSGSVHDLRIGFSTADGETVTVTGIEINVPIGVHFSLIRFLVMFLGSLAVYALSSDKLLRRSWEQRRLWGHAAAWSFTLCLIVLAAFLTNMSRVHDPAHSVYKDMRSTHGNQISQEIVDAFEDGHTYLNLPVSEELAALDNPYDRSQRDTAGISHAWDHLLYNGRYYSYYGIGPVLVLFLPYHKLTGYYFPSSWAVWLFGVLGMIFLTMMYLCFIEKFFRRINASLALIGLAVMQMSTGIFFNFYSANFYEIAQASGFLCVTAGAYFMLCSNVIGDGQIKNRHIAVSSACLSMGVLCRPTLAVYCIAALLFIFAGFRKKKSAYDASQSKSKPSGVRYYLPYLLCSLLPFVLIGAVQMWYNWARFGNPLDFGIQYSLTINDFTHAQYHTHFALLGIYSYLIAYPEFSERFPFLVAGGARTFNANGYYFLATGAAMGLLWRALPITAYCKSLQAYRVSKNRNKLMYTVLIAAVCIVCPAVIIFSVWESGYGTRYCVDFAWQIIIGALAICFTIYSRCRENTQRLLNTVMTGAGILSLAVNFAQLWTYTAPENAFTADWSAKALTLARLFEFWR